MPDTVYVDLSNVCRDQSFGRSQEQASWRRWATLKAAVKNRLGTDTTFQLVADENLRRKFSRSDQVRFDQQSNAHRLKSADHADQLLLQSAIESGGIVLSNDNFTDFMKTPGITEVRVLRWANQASGPKLREVRLVVPHSILITERIEDGEIKGGWAEPVDLAHRWTCTNAACSEQLVLVPNFRKEDAQCPSCAAYLTDEGEWRDAVMLKVVSDDKVVHRRILEDGDSLVVGRAPESPTAINVSPYLSKRTLNEISRSHVRVRNSQGRLTVEDLESTNGSHVLKPAERRLRKRAWHPAAPLRPGSPVPLDRGVRIRLAETPLILEISGRTFGR